MSEEVMAVSAAGAAAAPKHVTRLVSTGSAATRAMGEQARRRRDAEAKLQQHLLQLRDKQAE
ncbi:hypothetical protein AB0N24_16225 [Arthrobacter sp. NPDC093128]|uniref:hypothetical protein n=1 Tax=unclassified Arthrobacter TaxID=235627 RepID=UPI000CE39D67|nr:hypothetical protein [Arthrobacter sp. Y81]